MEVSRAKVIDRFGGLNPKYFEENDSEQYETLNVHH